MYIKDFANLPYKYTNILSAGLLILLSAKSFLSLLLSAFFKSIAEMEMHSQISRFPHFQIKSPIIYMYIVVPLGEV